jgi:hypothetical protein|tara:strand:+ start:894 stop:1163 length:270 start_codon:yes stop_codon:yes gene_type:complete
MKTFDEMKLSGFSDQELLTEISLGKVSSTVVIARLLGQVNKFKDRELGQILRTLGILIYITSLQHKSKRKEELNSNRNKEFKRKRIKTW